MTRASASLWCICNRVKATCRLKKGIQHDLRLLHRYNVDCIAWKRRYCVRILTPELKWVIFMLFCVTDKNLKFFCFLRRGFKHRIPPQQANPCTDEGLKWWQNVIFYAYCFHVSCALIGSQKKFIQQETISSSLTVCLRRLICIVCSVLF